jgi:ribosomal-protein-alanine N-acetyltransferase
MRERGVTAAYRRGPAALDDRPLRARSMQLLTQRLIIRSWKDSDRKPFAEMSEDADVMEHLRPLATRDACNAWIDFQIDHESSHGFCLWALESRASGIFMGAAGLLHVSFAARFTPAVEVGWRLAGPF